MKFDKYYEAVMASGGAPSDAMSDAPYVSATMNDPESPNAIYLCQKDDTGEKKKFKSKVDRDNHVKDNKGWSIVNESIISESNKINNKNINSAQKMADDAITELTKTISDYVSYPDKMSSRFEDKNGRTDMTKYVKARDSYINFFNEVISGAEKMTAKAKKGV